MTNTLAPITIPIPPHVRTRLAQLNADAQHLLDRQNEILSTVVASHLDPSTVKGWSVVLRDAEIICTPPVDTGPALVA